MDEDTILRAVCRLRPGTAWNIRDGALEQAEDNSPRVSTPSAAEIESAISSDPTAYIEKRAKEYPSIEDQLDALWKGGKEASDMNKLILAIKEKYPK